MKKIYNRVIVTIIAMVLLLMPLQSFAAEKTVTIIEGQVTITDDQNSGSFSDGTYTATVSAGYTAKTNTIHITNKSDADATISFSYSVENQTAFSIAGIDLSATSSGESSEVVKAREDLEIQLTTKGGLFSTKKATLTLTNITYSAMAESSDITVLFDSECGTVTANGVNVENEEVVTVDKAGATFVATPINGAKFIAWVEADGKVISKQTSYTQSSTGNKIIKALFSKTTPYFMVDNTYMLSDLNEAVEKGTNLVLFCDGTLAAGEYTIPAGKTLLIPFDAANTMYTTVPGHGEDAWNSTSSYVTPTAYRTLTMESGANITVNGAISVSAKQSSAQRYTGHPDVSYGLIDMKSGSSITVNNGGNLYVWGYITGKGAVTAESGATVYECFQITDWRGGTAISGMIDDTQGVFPMSQYYVQNIEVPLTLKEGAVENGYTSAFATLAGTQGCDIPFIGPQGMFIIEEGSITKDYDEGNDRLLIDVNGRLNMNEITIEMNLGTSGKKKITSGNFILPINGNITLDVNSGSTVNISQDMALLPGGVINVKNDAECILTSGVKVFIYDSDNWGEYCFGNRKYAPVEYAPGRINTRTDAHFVDAKIYIEGVVDASEGEVYVTEAGANICGGEGGVVRFNKVDDAVTYQATQNDKAITYVSIPVTTAKLKNGEGAYVEYVEHDGKHSEFSYSDGVWNPTHNYVNYICECGKKKIITNTGYNIDGENIIITPTIAEDDDLAKVIMVAVYDSSYKMLDSKSFLKSQLDKVTFSNKDVNMIKVFAWGGFDTIEPIALIEERSVQQ